MSLPFPASSYRRKIVLPFYDTLWIAAAPFLALYLRNGELAPHGGWEAVILYWLITTGFCLFAIFVFRIPERMTRYFSVKDGFDIYKAVASAELVSCVVLFTLTRLDGVPRSIPLIHGMLVATGLVAARMLFAYQNDDEFPENSHRRGSVILIGADRASAFFIRLLNAYPAANQRVIAVLDERPEMAGRAISGVRILGTPDRLSAAIDEFAIHGVAVERVVIASENLLSPAALQEIRRVCRACAVDLSLLPAMLGLRAAKPAETDEEPPAEAAAPGEFVAPAEFAAPADAFYLLDETPIVLPAYFILKRWIDVFASITLIILLSPLLLAGSFLAFVDVGSPILFWQERLGRNGRSFLIYKLRTVRSPFDRHGNPVSEAKRVSPVGRFLRASHLDELPQLFNVLIGDMSLIGPRPLVLQDQPPDIKIRSLVRPGITGWAQVKGGKLVTPQDKQQLDEWYVSNASPWVDCYILLMTLRIVLKSAAPSEESQVDVSQVHSRSAIGRRTFALRRDLPGRMWPVNVVSLPDGQPRLGSGER